MKTHTKKINNDWERLNDYSITETGKPLSESMQDVRGKGTKINAVYLVLQCNKLLWSKK